MTPILEKIKDWIASRWFGLTGWLLLALLLAGAAPRIRQHLVTHLPALQRENWRRVMAAKKSELADGWRDQRPLLILAGDSHIEFGHWYDLFDGARAVRNCGLSRAKIADVTELVAAIGDRHPQMVVLMCGINNLGAGDTIADCLRDYATLVATGRSHLQPASILVLSAMPVRESLVDRASHQFNEAVRQFNTGLATVCGQQQVLFLNVNAAISDANGGLAASLTIDGLHLNADGYRRLAAALNAALPAPERIPCPPHINRPATGWRPGTWIPTPTANTISLTACGASRF